MVMRAGQKARGKGGEEKEDMRFLPTTVSHWGYGDDAKATLGPKGSLRR